MGWTLPFVWAGLWTLITIPWVQADLRREKDACAKGLVQGDQAFTDYITGPLQITRLVSTTGHIVSKFPFRNTKTKSENPTSSDKEAKEQV
jgi:hypothetical protein